MIIKVISRPNNASSCCAAGICNLSALESAKCPLCAAVTDATYAEVGTPCQLGAAERSCGRHPAALALVVVVVVVVVAMGLGSRCWRIARWMCAARYGRACFRCCCNERPDLLLARVRRRPSPSRCWLLCLPDSDGRGTLFHTSLSPGD